MFALVSCTGQIQDPSTLVTTPAAGEFFESWNPDTVTAPGANLITFTGIDSETTWPYYSSQKTYPIKFKINSGGLPAGVIDPGIYSAKLEYSADNGITWAVISGAANIPVSAGLINTFDWALPSLSLVDGSGYLLRLTATAVSGNKTTATSSQSFFIDATAPVISALSLTLGSLGVAGPTTVSRSFFGFSVTATDSLTPIKYYCLKADSAPTTVPPLSTDDCWKDFGAAAATNINLTNQSGFIGFVAGAYYLRLWVQDSAGNISTLSAGIGVVNTDRVDVAYNLAVAPIITNVLISNNDSSSLNPLKTETVFAAGQNVYVRWNATDADLTGTPISLYYTTDEINFLPISAFQNITNLNQGGCTVDINYSGCAVFTAPTAGYFRVQISAIDQTGLISKGGSNAVNMLNFSQIAGNTDLGLGGSANKAIFINKTINNVTWPQAGILTVAKNGKIFYLDNLRGILIIDPLDGAQKIYIPKSALSTGDGGSYLTATTANTLKIALDYKDRLLIFETNRIRRVENTGTINTIIGGGTQAYDNVTKLAIPADQFKMNIPHGPAGVTTSRLMFQPLPNGNIWFDMSAYNSTYNNILFGIYKASDQKVYFLGLKGNGAYGLPTYDLSGPVSAPTNTNLITTPALSFDYRTSQLNYLTMYFCRPVPGGCVFYSANFNPNTGENMGYGTHYPMVSYWGVGAYISSRKGELYNFSRLDPAGLYKLNNSNLQWDKILGNDLWTSGVCADGTLAAACGVDLADVFIAEDKTVYFVDRGGVIRVILPDKKIKTLFGQGLSFGDAGPPTSARIGIASWLGIWGSNDTVVVYDSTQAYIREFASSGGVGSTINKICGNGLLASPAFTAGNPISVNLALDEPCFGTWLSNASMGMAVDSRNGEIYTSLSGRAAKLLRGGSGANAGKWQSLAGYGSTNFFADPASDNQLGSTVKNNNYPMTIFGLLQPDGFSTINNPPVGTMPAVENGQSDAFVLLSGYHWNGTQAVNPYYKTARGSDGMIRPMSGALGAVLSQNLPAVGTDFSVSLSKPLYESYTEANYVQEDRSVLFGQTNTKNIIRTPLTRDGLDQITGAGLISNVYVLPTTYTSFAYRWAAGAISEIFYCSMAGTLNKYTVASGVNVVCNLPKTSAGADMYTCYGKSLHWNFIKTKLIFPIRQNGLTAVGEYDVAGCL